MTQAGMYGAAHGASQLPRSSNWKSILFLLVLLSEYFRQPAARHEKRCCGRWIFAFLTIGSGIFAAYPRLPEGVDGSAPRFFRHQPAWKLQAPVAKIAEVEMSNRMSDCPAELKARLFKQGGDGEIRAPANLELENFELRNEVTRLTLHNATLRRMLTNRGLKAQ
ncbi:MAG: hypothetical protein JOZ66_05365 [Hyphomicrobiales bacterium]|nr:hypothetical protein [Hyphomicrobiales bacterium]